MTTDPWANLLNDLLAAVRDASYGRENVIERRAALDNIEAVLHAALSDPVVLPVLMQHLNAKAGWHYDYERHGKGDKGWIVDQEPIFNNTMPCWVVVAPQEPKEPSDG